ncbi:IclR family transcriptional regulator [Nocardia fusca]|jgi:DNA-binding IclR family transcriptional regulator|uniref:IclR family transcriptional regulator n=1 Tax=Nocardia fusca TaxID=941183 RepID=A0ABV3F3W4_9NOCA|nr:IclR family transcriptional regulator [Nocardia fusca]
MRNPPLPERPSSAVGSLDRGLRLLQLLRDYGSLRVMDAAADLDISRSSAHRLLQTLAYRGFAVQDESHVYFPGPSLDAAPARLAWTKTFRALCQPHLEVLSRRSGESANLMVRVRDTVRFLGTVRAQSVYATNDRDGVVMPAHRASGGKALLATLPEEELRQLYRRSGPGGNPGLDEDEFRSLTKSLAQVSARGFAVNFEETERGVAAVGVAINDRAGHAVGAVSLSSHAARFTGLVDRTFIPLLLDTRTQIEKDLMIIDLDIRDHSK